MYRVLIVDDEPIIADGLYEELLLCDSLDVDAYRTYSGKGALAILEKHRIDIVITDIKMPGMDGIALLECIRGNWPQCRVIFLTGHREFDYVYKAIQYTGLQYVLKTEGYARVISAVQNAIAELDSERMQTDRQDALLRRMDSASMFLQKDYIKSLLAKENPESIKSKDFQECGICLHSDEMVLLVIGRIHFDVEAQAGYSELVNCFYSIRLIAEQYLSARLLVACVPDDQSDIVMLLQPDKLKEQPAVNASLWDGAAIFVKETLELLQGSIKKSLGCTVSFGVASRHVHWRDLSSTYELTKRLMDFRIGPGEEMLLVENITGMDPKLTAFNTEQTVKMKAKAELLSVYLDRGERDAYFKIFDGLAATLESFSTWKNTVAQELYFSISLILLSYLNRWQLHEKITQTVDPGALSNPGKFSSWPYAVNFLRQISTALFDSQQVDQDKRADDILKRLKTYIDSHLGEELSLLKLSELMYFNPSYLSRLFKQLNGENLTDYIQNKRIGKARDLLGKYDLKISEIAMAVGFVSATNFTRFFKKATGMTPADYRDRLSAGKVENGM